MTLILTLANSTQVIQIFDRRLTSAGKIITDNANKAITFECPDGRFAVGFTGLARSGQFNFEPWLVDALGKCAPPDFQIREIIGRLASLLTTLFSTHPDIKLLPAFDRRLSVILSGYAISKCRERIGDVLISNFQGFEATAASTAQPEFQVFRCWNRSLQTVIRQLCTGSVLGPPCLNQARRYFPTS